ncbi:MAG: amidohydrolase [Ignavibacteria bacterium]|nr:amidohydrolase [Ignavibacteria bacterium]
MRIRSLAATLVALLLSVHPAHTQDNLNTLLNAEISALLSTYKYLHENPELSHFEEKTGSFVARELRAIGYDVTERVGAYRNPRYTSYGIVAVLKNGTGPTVLLRTDLDALPLEENTGLPYASKVTTKDEAGREVGVMHACGHDLHMTAFLGAAKSLYALKNRWRGTLVLVAQPAEETGTGAQAMLEDGLYQRFPKPDYAIALHADALTEAGKVGYCDGYALANVSSVDIVVRGVGGHGAYPHGAKDPVLVASQLVVNLQSIVSREISPLEPAVVTVGSIHGGSKHNIIPDDVHLQLTVRSYKREVHFAILDAVERIAHGTAQAAGIPADRMPIVTTDRDNFLPATYNNPALTLRLAEALRPALGKENVVKKDPVMGAEDFGRYGLEDQSVPICLFWLGTVDPALMKRHVTEGVPLPGLHSSQFAPLAEPSIRAGVKTLTTAALELLKK